MTWARLLELGRAAWPRVAGAARSSWLPVVFIAVLVLTAVSGWVLQKLVAAVGLGVLDRLLGAVFGSLRGVIVLLVITVIAGMTPMQDTATWRQSEGARALTQLLHFLKPVLPADFGKYLP